MRPKSTFSWFILAGLLVALIIADLSIGSVHIPVSELVRILFTNTASEPIYKEIVWDFRMTKALTCILAGAGLALSGLQMQTLFRNALAGPDVLGLSSGASLAVSLIFLTSGLNQVLFPLSMPWAVAAAASVGCAGVLVIMLAIARTLQDNVSLLIVGLMIGAATSSFVSVLQFLSRAEQTQVYIIWTFGSLGGLNWNEIIVLAFILLTGLVLSIFNVKSLNAWLLGDFYAQSLGVNIRRSRFWIIIAASILTGGITAFCGPIAFVGLAVPHLVKILIKTSNHKTLIPAVVLGGASLMLFCDIITQLPDEYTLPINAITAMIGAPVVISLIIKTKIVRT